MSSLLSEIEFDTEGYLVNLTDWSKPIALQLAKDEQIDMTAEHWQIVDLIRRFHQEFEHAPAMRPLVKYVTLQLGKDKGNSLYLMQLFPGSPAKLAAKIAGLPKPTNCI